MTDVSLQERIQSDVKDAMRAGDALRRDTLRMVIAAFTNRRIELGDDLTEEQELAVLASAVKSRTDSATQYEDAGRSELAEKERAEISVIEGYLPARMSDDDTRAAVAAKIAELQLSSRRELGQLMKAVMAEHKGTLDGKTVQRIAAELLT